MTKRNISKDKIIQAFLTSAFEKSAGATSLTDVSDFLQIKKASLYNHFEGRDAIYNATIEFSTNEIASVSFLADKTLDTIKNGKSAPLPMFKRLITRFFELYESEPLFQIYVLIHTEQYFNVDALNAVNEEHKKIAGEIYRVIAAFIDAEKIPSHSEKEIKEAAEGITSIIFEQRDSYIAKRKETVRQNPESGAGSLFALPTDDEAVLRTIKYVECYLKPLL